jgi:hypothetical protein
MLGSGDPARTGMIQHRLSGLETCNFEQRLQGRAGCGGNSGRLLEGHQ